jgi:hypothetical protein
MKYMTLRARNLQLDFSCDVSDNAMGSAGYEMIPR